MWQITSGARRWTTSSSGSSPPTDASSRATRDSCALRLSPQVPAPLFIRQERPAPPFLFSSDRNDSDAGAQYGAIVVNGSTAREEPRKGTVRQLAQPTLPHPRR